MGKHPHPWMYESAGHARPGQGWMMRDAAKLLAAGNTSYFLGFSYQGRLHLAGPRELQMLQCHTRLL